MIEDLLAAFAAGRAEADPVELADILWLAACVDGASRPSAPVSSEESPSAEADGRETLGEGAPALDRPAAQLFAVPAGHKDERFGEVGRKGVAVRVPRAATLHEPLAVMRALRPLGRRAIGGPGEQLDEQRTVERSVEQFALAPVLRPAESRWLDLALVVDTHHSMLLWADLVDELRRILTRSGVFRDVRTWFLTGTEAGGIPMVSHIRGTAPRPPAEVADPSGRRLVLTVTDTVADGWRSAPVQNMLRHWSGHNAVALLNILPERLWTRGSVRPSPYVLRTNRPAGASGSWHHRAAARRSRPARRRDRAASAPGSPVPVVPMVDASPESLSRLARLVSGNDRWQRMLCLPLDAPRGPRPAEATPHRPPAPAQDGLAAVERFRANASPTAQQLAAHLAAVPLTLPVMTLVRRSMLPSSEHGHLAEVALGGLFAPWDSWPADTPVDELQFDFRPGVREVLLGSQLRRDVSAVRELVRRSVWDYLASNRGTGREFSATRVGDGADGSRTVRGDQQSFAEQRPSAVQDPLASGGPHERVAARSGGLAERMVTVWTDTPSVPGPSRGAGILLTPRLVLTCAQGAAAEGAEHWHIHGRTTMRARRLWSSAVGGPGVALLMAEEHVIDTAAWADRIPGRLRWAAPRGHRPAPVRVHAHSEANDPVTLRGDMDLQWKLPVVEVTEPHPTTGWPQLSGAVVSYDDALVGFVIGQHRDPQRLVTLTGRALIADSAFRTALSRNLRTPYELEEIDPADDGPADDVLFEGGPVQTPVPASVCLAIEVKAYSREPVPSAPREVERAVSGILTTLMSRAHVEGTVTETPAAGSPDLTVVIEGAAVLLGTGRLLAALPDAVASYNEGLGDLVVTLGIAASAGETARAADEARLLAKRAFPGHFRRDGQDPADVLLAVSEPFRREVERWLGPAGQGHFAPLGPAVLGRAEGWLCTSGPARLGEAIVVSEQGGTDAAAPVTAVYRSVRHHLRSALPRTYRDEYRRDADRLLLVLLAFAAGLIDGVEQVDSERALVHAVEVFLVDRGIPAERDMDGDVVVWSSDAGPFEVRVARDGTARTWSAEPSVSFELVLDREAQDEMRDLVDCVSTADSEVLVNGERSCLVAIRLPVPDHRGHDDETPPYSDDPEHEAMHPSLGISGFRQDTLFGAVESACEQLLGDSVEDGATADGMDGLWSLNGAALPSGLVDLSIQDITPDMDSIAWDMVEEYEYGLVLGQLTVDAELVLEGFMLKSDYYLSAQDVSLVGEGNEHMVEVTVRRNAQLRFFTRQDMNEIELEFGGTTSPEPGPHDPM
ncbi:SAV_2336 N-terminal domain-related protein [Streptomyces sp. NPDC127039]|uniref:SAV_2336 N-terminal domain-related protein n=1 Tax=Streptomyces sp. NPDC127039 TaxID=3347115 RepID=UPI0036683D05